MHMCIYLMTLGWITMIPIHDDDHYRSSFIRKHFSNNSFFFNVSLPVHRKMPERGKQCMIYPFNFMFYQQIIHRNWAKKSVILIEFGFCVQDETELWSNPYVFVWTVDRTFLYRSRWNWGVQVKIEIPDPARSVQVRCLMLEGSRRVLPVWSGISLVLFFQLYNEYNVVSIHIYHSLFFTG